MSCLLSNTQNNKFKFEISYRTTRTEASIMFRRRAKEETQNEIDKTRVNKKVRENIVAQDDEAINNNADSILVDLKSLKSGDFESYVSDLAKKRKVRVKVEDGEKKELGFIHLPRKTIIEALYCKNLYLKPLSDNGRGEVYYVCADESCPYKIKIFEDKQKIMNLTLTSLLNAFKNINLDIKSELQEGICKITQLAPHNEQHDNAKIEIFKRDNSGKYPFEYLY